MKGGGREEKFGKLRKAVPNISQLVWRQDPPVSRGGIVKSEKGRVKRFRGGGGGGPPLIFEVRTSGEALVIWESEGLVQKPPSRGRGNAHFEGGVLDKRGRGEEPR